MDQRRVFLWGQESSMHIGESTTCRISEEKLLDLEIGHFEAAGGRFFPAQCLTHDQSRNFLLDIWVGGGTCLVGMSAIINPLFCPRGGADMRGWHVCD